MNTSRYPSEEKPPVLFVPGGVMPVNLSYAQLLKVLGTQIHPITKELEVYASDSLPRNYGIDLEIEGIRRTADAAGVQSFHLVGYSAGGAFSLAFLARYPERVRSLALIEPAWIGALTPEDAKDWAEMNSLMLLPPEKRMIAFRYWQMRPGEQPPVMQKPGEPEPAWMANRPAGLEAFIRVFNASQIDQNRFRQFHRPVYFAYGTLSTRYYERQRKILSRLFPDFQAEEYVGRSHFDPPQRAEAERFARVLHDLWERAATPVNI